MTSLDSYALTDRYTNDQGRVFLTGVQALARLPIGQLRIDRANGLDTAAFLSGYQGSPLGGLDQEVARALREVSDLPIVARPAVNEELAATAVMGSQLVSTQDDARHDGVVGFWYGKAPGLDRASDAIRHAMFAGTSRFGGAVALVGDDPACKSSTLPSSSDTGMIDLNMPTLYPGDVQEVLDLGRHAVVLSRLSGLWAGMKIVTAVADGSSSVDIDLDRIVPVVPDLAVDGSHYVARPSGRLIAPYTNEMEREIREVRLVIARRYGVANGLNRVTVDPEDGWIGIVATGYTYYETLESLRRLGLDSEQAIEDAGIRILHLRMPYPFDPDVVRHFARGLDEIVVVEEKNPTLEWLTKDALYGGPDQPVVTGKFDDVGLSLIPSDGFLTADLIVPALRSRLAGRLADRLTPEPKPVRAKALIPVSSERAPYFCSGCPHNWGTKAPDDSLIGAGIGCSGMALLMDESKVGDIAGITCMGTEGSQWIGMEPFLDRDHFIQNLGDGTYFHSGQLAIQAALAAGSHLTYKLLYNGTVAMTGGQDPSGALGVPELTMILLTQGVTEVVITTDDRSAYDGVALPSGNHGGETKVWDRSRIVEAQEYLATVPGVTVLIHDQACAAQARRLRKRGQVATPAFRIAINHRICEACGDCGEVSNCLSVQSVDTPLGPKTTIDQTSCNLDYSCVSGDCPSFMQIVPASEARRSGLPGSDGPGEDFPDPVSITGEDRVHVRLAGIGGTGVVTVAQILGTAAMLDGWDVRGLDQTGLSQKAGPVVSDLRLSRDVPAVSNLVGEGEADVILAFDLLVGSGAQALKAASPDRTVLISSSTETPTGEMIGDPDLAYPELGQLSGRAANETRSELNRFVDAGGITRGILGDAATANVFMLGVAVQAGAIPVEAETLERAIDLNGVAVEANRTAFRWGRRWAVDADTVESAAGLQTQGRSAATVEVSDLPDALVKRVADLELDDQLESLVTTLAADLVGFQNARYADRYLDLIERSAGHERISVPGSLVFTEAVARGLHKLMAYKDEYEVARLLIGPEAAATAEAVGGPGAKVIWKLHPPMLKSMGLNRKIGVNASFGRPIMSALARSKRLRGTPLDPFGRSEMRRLERALIDEYEQAVIQVLPDLAPDTLDRGVEFAESAMKVRGYEELKLERAAIFRARLARGLTG